MYDVLDEVAGKWKELDDTQRSQIATALGGTRQKEVVLALMENWDRVAKYVKVAEDSTGSASDKMQYYLESVEAAQKRLTAAWEEFVYSEGLTKLVAGWYDFWASLPEVLNKVGDWFSKFGWTSEEFAKEADDTQSKIQENIDRINEINAMSWQDKTAKIIEEKNALEKENAELEKNLKLQRERQMSALNKELEQGYGAYVTNKATGATTAMSAKEYQDFVNQGLMNPNYFDVKKLGVEDALKSYNELLNTIQNSNSLTDEQIEKINSLGSTYDYAIANLKARDEAYRDGISGARQLTAEEQALLQAAENLSRAFDDKRQAATEAEKALVSNAKKLIENEKDADKAKEALIEFVNIEIILNNTKLDLSQQIAQINAIAEAAGAATSAINALGSVQAVIRGGQPFFEYNGKLYRSSQEAMAAYSKDVIGLTKPGTYSPDATTSGSSGSSSDPNEALKKAAQNQIKLINKMKDKIKEDIDEINDKWDEEADALEEANNKLEKQIEYQKLLEAMAKAKSQKKMIYKDGRFQYLEDIDAISEAQDDLEEFYREKDLQDKKDYIEEQRKLELKDLEDQQKYLEDKVDYWNDYIDRLDSDFASYMDIFDDFLEKQKNGYFSDLNALREYVENKEALLGRLSTAGTGTGYGNGITPSGTTTDTATTAEPVKKLPHGGGGPKHGMTQFYAEGTTYAKGGLSVVGEKGAELRVLNRGDGIIPADITKNLWKWGTIDPEKVNDSGKTNIQNYNIDVDNVNLPDVTNPEEFISGIKNLALQRAYNR